MRRLISAAIIISVLVLAGCGSKGINARQNQEGPKASTLQGTEAPYGLKPVKPGTVPQLSAKQKNEVDTKVNSALNSIDNTLKSMQDPQDIDVTSVN